jgi:hypothetical protein
MPGMTLQRWTAWMPGCETPLACQEWAQAPGYVCTPKDTEILAPHVREIPPLLRRRAGPMGRATLQVLTRPELPYDGQSIILCSRFGEFARSLELQRELARDGMVSPQQFSMAVHNATGGLFMMAKKSQAPLTALCALEETALAGLQEAQGQLLDGANAVWLVYGDEPLPVEYRYLSDRPDDHLDYFAFLLELTLGEDFYLSSAPSQGSESTELDDPTKSCRPLDPLRGGDLSTELDGPTKNCRPLDPLRGGDLSTELDDPTKNCRPLDLLRFFLRPEKDCLHLSSRGGWSLRRRQES